MINIKEFDVKKFDSILARGLSNGLGKQGSQVCIEAAVCEALGLPHGDDPGCVANSVRSFKIRLNDSRWSAEKARAAGLRDLGLAQLGSKGVVDGVEFMKRVAEKTIRVLIPKIFKLTFPTNKACLIAAARCAEEGTKEAAAAAAQVGAAAAAAYAADAAAAYAAHAAAAAQVGAAAVAADEYLILSAKIALEVLRELNSPGIALL